MNIHIFTQHFFPETVATGRRARDVAEAMSARGHQVTVLTGVPNHPSSIGRAYCAAAAQEEVSESGYRIVRVPVYRSPDPRAWRRLVTYATYLLAAAWRGIRGSRPDLVLAVSPLPTGLAAMLAKWWHRTPLVFDLQDIWPESARAVGMMSNGWPIRLLRQIERFFYGQCSVVVVISEGFKGYLQERGVPAEQTAVIHNGVDWELFSDAVPDATLCADAGLAGKFLVGYIGNLGLAQRLDTVLDAAEMLDSEPAAFLLMGDGVDKHRLQQQTKARRLRNVHFLEGAPRTRVPSILAACDALLVILRDDPLFEITIPSKLYEYLAAGKPCLCSVGGEAARLVKEHKCGLAVPPADARALAAAVKQLRHDPELARALGQAGRSAARRYYSRTLLMEQYGEILEALGHGTLPVTSQQTRKNLTTENT